MQSSEPKSGPRVTVLTLTRDTVIGHQWPGPQRDPTRFPDHFTCARCQKKIDIGSRMVRVKFLGHDKFYHAACFRT